MSIGCLLLIGAIGIAWIVIGHRYTIGSSGNNRAGLIGVRAHHDCQKATSGKRIVIQGFGPGSETFSPPSKGDTVLGVIPFSKFSDLKAFIFQGPDCRRIDRCSLCPCGPCLYWQAQRGCKGVAPGFGDYAAPAIVGTHKNNFDLAVCSDTFLHKLPYRQEFFLSHRKIQLCCTN
jgi:hypothetical protein